MTKLSISCLRNRICTIGTIHNRSLTTKTIDLTERDFLPARRYASAGNSDRNVSVRLSVRHAPVLRQNEES